VSNVQGDPTNGIGIFNFGGSGLIQGDAVDHAQNGIVATFSAGTQFLGNTVVDCTVGIHTDNVGIGGSFALATGDSLDAISGNTVSNGLGTQSSGIFVYKPGFAVTVGQNTVSGVQTALALYGGVNNPLVEFLNNTVDGQGQTLSNGLLMTTDQLDGTTGAARGLAFRNAIRNFTVGVQLFQLDATAILTATLHGNVFSGSVTAVGDGNVGTPSAPVDASFNFWDSPTGPTIPNNPHGLGQSIVDGSDGSIGVVIYGPFLTTPFLTTSFLVSVAPSSQLTFGQQVTVTITAKAPSSLVPSTVDTSYTGTVILDGGGVLSGPAMVVFAPSDQGVKTFTLTAAAAGSGILSVVDSLSDASVFGSFSVT
jgi:hypothetical protein